MLSSLSLSENNLNKICYNELDKIIIPLTLDGTRDNKGNKMQKLSPHSKNCTKIYPMVNLFENMTKYDWIQHLQNFESDFYILVKEEVQQLFFKTGNFVPLHASFDELYSLSVQDTICQFSKNIMRKKDWLLDGYSDNNLIYKKIKQRLVNNIRNLFDPKRRTNVLTIGTALEYTHNERKAIYCSIDTDTDDVLSLIKTKPQVFKKYLKKIYYDLENDDFNYLLSLSKFNVNDVLGFYPTDYLYSIKKDTKNQAFFDFMEAV